MARLLGSGSKGITNNPKFGGRGGTTPGTINMLDPSKSGDPDVVQQRAAQAGRAVMLKNALRASRSVGLRIVKR